MGNEELCGACRGPMTRGGYDEWGRFVCGTCVAKASLLEGERRALESESGGLHVDLVGNPVQGPVEGILAGMVLLMTFFMCGGTGLLMVGMTYYEESQLSGMSLGFVGLVLIATPVAYALYRVRRSKHANQMDDQPPGDFSP